MTSSVIIPTYRRPDDLQRCLKSLAAQSCKPSEIIIVDTAPDQAAHGVATEWANANSAVALSYLRCEINSLTAARNRGKRLATGDVIIFLDDDVVLHTDYIKDLLQVYEEQPAAKGAQGYIAPGHRPRVHELFNRVFFWYHLEPGRCRVLPSVSATYPQDPSAVVSCEWLSGANHSYRREVLDSFDYDERLLKYADGEDLDLSYRVHCRYPGSLFLTPRARLIHSTSPAGRAVHRELIYMREIYGAYLFAKLFDPSPYNLFVYLWSRAGRLLLSLLSIVVKRQKGQVKECACLISAYWFCLRNMRSIRHGDFRSFNDGLMTPSPTANP